MSEPAAPFPPRSAFSRLVPWLLLILGLQLVLVWGGAALPLKPTVQIVMWAALLLILLLAALPAVAQWIGMQSDRYPRSRIGRTALIFSTILFSSAALYFIARAQSRTFLPSYHDEFSYLIQARMILAGRLWLPAPSAARWFESFQVISEPVYASIYFPGAAVMYATGTALQLPGWATAVLLAGTCAALVGAIARTLFGAWAGWVAVVMLLGLSVFRLQSVMVMAQVPLLACGLGALLLWLHWNRSPSISRAAGIGALLGFAAITRPIDALCFAIPIATAMLVSTLRGGDINFPRQLWLRRRAVELSVAAVATLPFIAIQLVFNHGVTGSIFKTPFSIYAQQTFPGAEYGFQAKGQSLMPTSRLQQKQVYYENDVRGLLITHTPVGAAKVWCEARSRQVIVNSLPHATMLALLLIGLIALRRIEVCVVVAPAVLFPILFWPYPFFLPHYTLTAAPSIIVLALAGVDTFALTCNGRAAAVRVGTAVAVIGLCIVELPSINRANFDEFFTAPQLRQVDSTLNALPSHERSIVLFRFAGSSNPQEEPVYNTDHAEIFDHRVVRGHDLGDDNVVMLRELPAIEQDRVVYIYDRGDDTIRRLGTVAELLAAHSAARRI